MRLWLHSGGTFGEAESEVRHFLGEERRILFVPYALHDLDAYVGKIREVAGAWGFEISSTHEASDPVGAVRSAPSIFVGGGNTFRLLTTTIRMGLLDAIREAVEGGVPYLGSSAGSNLACPTIKTTNDMPIVYPPTFESLGLVPFQINPHYQDPDPTSTHRGETRERRIQEFHEMNSLPVIGLREGSLLLRDGDTLELRGTVGARLFQQGQEATEHRPGERLDRLLLPVTA